VFAIIFGVFPHHIPGLGIPSILQYMDATVDRQVEDLTDWTRRHEAGMPETALSQSEANRDAIAASESSAASTRNIQSIAPVRDAVAAIPSAPASLVSETDGARPDK